MLDNTKGSFPSMEKSLDFYIFLEAVVNLLSIWENWTK